jgi:uncharacterized protein YndB with AHSA1/START domain
MTDPTHEEALVPAPPGTFLAIERDLAFPREMLLTVTFTESDGKTHLRLKLAGIPAGKDMDGARQGWNQSFDKLAVVLAGAKEEPSGR